MAATFRRRATNVCACHFASKFYDYFGIVDVNCGARFFITFMIMMIMNGRKYSTAFFKK